MEIQRYLDVRPKDAYPQSVMNDIKLLSFFPNGLATPFGSYIYRMQKYPGDVDLIEVFKECCTVEKVVKDFTYSLKNIIKNIITTKYHYFSEFKAGLDNRYDINVGTLENGIYNIHPELQQRSLLLHNQNLLTIDQFNLVNKVIRKHNPNDTVKMSNAYDIIFNMFRDLRILRWTSNEILRGYKQHNGKTFLLESALTDQTAVKIDMISLINGRFVEVTNYLMLAIEENNQLIPINIDIIKGNYPPIGLPPEIEKLYFSNIYYSSFKVIKRMYALSRHLKDLTVLNNIIPFVSSNMSLLYQLKSEIETILRILEIVKQPPIDVINLQLDEMKNRFASIIEINNEQLMDILKSIDLSLNTWDIDSKIQILEKINKLMIKPIINLNTIKYLESVGYNPPPSHLLPKIHKYDRSLVRTPYESPNIEI